MDTVDGQDEDKSFYRTVLKYSAGLCLGLLLLVTYPVYVRVTCHADFDAGRLETHDATVLSAHYYDVFDGSTHGTGQQITLRLDNGTERTTPEAANWIEVDKVREGARVTVGLSQGRLVSVAGTYVGPGYLYSGLGLWIMTGALVLSGIYAVQLRRAPAGRSKPHTAGYVTQALMLYLLFTIVVQYSRYEAWAPVIAPVLATAIPLVIFWTRHRRPAHAL
ncbi:MULTISPECIES: hypothetical protein [unclassified Actinoplanes]|uniref:hypothetical protein n=1 Tax=unclassified Actinoplanes TaxID=2626549 RepID=UPI00031EF06A|nr:MULTISPECIES: hypothetical protein [unclassified Actinoplanes]SLM00093.1 hypothetical protein ACSP50_3325 [Actinoplanes sp. SE50/110]